MSKSWSSQCLNLVDAPNYVRLLLKYMKYHRHEPLWVAKVSVADYPAWNILVNLVTDIQSTITFKYNLETHPFDNS